MNGGLAAALDIHPRRRYTAHKRQSDKSAAAHIEFCSVLASLGVYTEFGIEPRPLSARERVRVSEDDVFEIVKRFDRRKVRITAFALLLYAKAFADENGEITFSYAELSAWTGLDASSIRKTYMPELLMFKFCEMARTDNRPFFKHGKTIHPRTKIKLLVPIQQDGEYEFDDDFIPQFDQIFASRNLRDMYYYGII